LGKSEGRSQTAGMAIRQQIQACLFEIVLRRKEMEIFAIAVTARFGFILFVGLSLFYIAMKLTP
jgi:hypothetical protein